MYGDISLNGFNVCGIPIHKLGQLEDIEEELGIELITLFKAYSKPMLYWRYEGKIVPSNDRTMDFDNRCIYAYVDTMTHKIYEFKDYGKTWALTEEELKNVNR